MIQSEKCDPVVTPPVKITKSIVETELEMHENTKTAIDNYKQATKYCNDYNKALYQVNKNRNTHSRLRGHP